MKRLIRLLTFVLTVLFCFSMTYGICLAYEIPEVPEIVDTSEIFDDVYANKWYKEAVDYAYTYNLFQGTSATKFEPDSPMNRAMFVTVLARIEDVNMSNDYSTKFADVPAGKWYTGAVKWAAANNIVNGVTETKFEPMSSITREQMCTMLVRYANYNEITLNRVVDKKVFTDDSKIKSYAKESVYLCQMAGLVNGMTETTFEPAGTATRAQVAKILMGFHKDYIYPILLLAQLQIKTNEAISDSSYRADRTSNYNYIDYNCIVNRDRQVNRTYLPSFDIDRTGFVRAGTKLSDLKDKTLEFFTVDDNPLWSYRNAKGETIDEWTWFKDLKDELGLNIKYTISNEKASIESALKSMLSGTQCDIIYTNDTVMPSALTISRDITELTSINDIGSSPGICKKTMDIFKFGNTYRLVSPIGAVEVLWYNQTLTQNLNLSDPHVMWEKGMWGWEKFYEFLNLAPATLKNGNKLTAFKHSGEKLAAIWPATAGAPSSYNEADIVIPFLMNNWTNPTTIEAWEFISSVINDINYDYTNDTNTAPALTNLGLYEGTTLMSGSFYPFTYRNNAYSKNIQINWVPYPTTDTYHTGTSQSMGIGMMLPALTVKEENVNIALKFMELWATRFTESIFDNLDTFEYYSMFNYKYRRQYFDFVTENVTFSFTFNNFKDTNLSTKTDFLSYFKNKTTNDMTSIANNAFDYVTADLLEALEFGVIS